MSEHIKGLVEAILFSHSQPLSSQKLKQLLSENIGIAVSSQQIKLAINQLVNDYDGRGVNLISVANGYRFQTANRFKDELTSLHQEKSTKISPAMMETLATIAYKQPITRSEIEEIRGVALSSYIIKTLSERQWIKVIGHREVPGRPAIYGTTKIFLSYFGLQSLKQLPEVMPISHSTVEVEDINIKETEA
ncbi:SMC-Scp complex subunit ScpB [Thalassotalea sp. M1531]|uniref:SMC-Scp complex subunit ScpB n=1 Tax=Thalassotalea algicola TaxID=2716224 RepID=A0A7Y0LFB6_9GAMM|nr:SMC-Scp complex subunit ScpB [Thalassotalea algicola]NMP33480.1 SMC-Scp complex subunit ScpB [Thalassotalea algicola]